MDMRRDEWEGGGGGGGSKILVRPDSAETALEIATAPF